MNYNNSSGSNTKSKAGLVKSISLYLCVLVYVRVCVCERYDIVRIKYGIPFKNLSLFAYCSFFFRILGVQLMSLNRISTDKLISKLEN